MSKYYPKKIELTIEVPNETADSWNTDLNRKNQSSDAGDIIDQMTVDCGLFGPDRVEVDIKLVNGDTESGPYLDCILFSNGCEVIALPPNRDKLNGRYEFVVEDYPDGDNEKSRSFTVIIEIRREGQSDAKSLLSGEHPSDGKSASELFPDADFQCYTCVISKHDGRLGNDILAQALARYFEAIEPMSREEAVALLTDMNEYLYEMHSDTGMGDTEPQWEISSVVSEKFEELGWIPVDRYSF